MKKLVILLALLLSTTKICLGADYAIMTSPVNGSNLTVSATTFIWSAGTKAYDYGLWVGTEGVAGRNIFDQSVGLVTNKLINIPITGNKVYVRLWTRTSSTVYPSTWVSQDYVYNTGVAPVASKMISPVNNSILTSSSNTFTWGAISNAQEYLLKVGRTLGGNDIYDQSQALRTSVNLTNIPITGGAVYVSLFTKIANTWYKNDYVYLTQVLAKTPAEFIYPTPESKITVPAPRSQLTFKWTTGSPDVIEYRLKVAKFNYGGGVAVFVDVNTALPSPKSTSHVINNLPFAGQYEKWAITVWSKFSDGTWKTTGEKFFYAISN